MFTATTFYCQFEHFSCCAKRGPPGRWVVVGFLGPLLGASTEATSSLDTTWKGCCEIFTDVSVTSGCSTKYVFPCSSVHS